MGHMKATLLEFVESVHPDDFDQQMRLQAAVMNTEADPAYLKELSEQLDRQDSLITQSTLERNEPMPVEIFTKQDFEAALPSHNVTGRRLWSEKGLDKGEYVYRVEFDHPLGHIIEVRSSIKANGESASNGEDSIRFVLLSKDNQLIASKASRWTTRVPGWQNRVLDQLRRLARLGKKLGKCECGKNQVTYKVKKDGPTKGRFFITCSERDCKRTKFLYITNDKGELL